MTLFKNKVWNTIDILGFKKIKAKKSSPLNRDKDFLQLSRLYETISRINKIIIRVHDRDTLFQEICNAAIIHGQFKFAWIGLTDNNSLLVHPVAIAGENNDYLSDSIISIRNDETGNGPIGRSIREGHCVVIHDIASDPSMIPWRNKAIKSGLHGAAAVPIKQKDVIIGGFIVYAFESMFFDDKEIKLLEEIGSDISFALDIIENEKQRAIAVKALHASEKHFSDLLENVNLIALILDVNGKVTFCNSYLLELTQYTLEEILGCNWFEKLIPPTDSNAQSILIKGISTGSILKHYENPIVTKNGTIRTICWNNTLLRDSSGAIIGTASIGEDTTDRNLAEELLRESELLFSKIFEFNPVSISIARLSDGKLTKVNNVWCQLMGYSAEESIGKDHYELKILRSEQRQQLREHYFEKGSFKLFESEITTKNGEIKTTLTSVETITIKEIKYSINLVIDITDRKIAENKIKLLSRAIEQSPVIVMITNKDGDIEYVNPKFTNTTGFTMDEIIGQNPRLLRSGEQSHAFYKELWTTILSGKDWHGQFHNKTKNGDLYWENAAISSIKDNKGQISHFIAIKEDITEMKKIMEDLLLAKEKAEESDRLKTAFLHNISHEIRTPINAIVGFSSLLNETEFDSPKRDHFTDIIIQSSNQLLSIITDLINIATIEAGQEKVNTKVVKINTILKLLLEQFSLRAQKEKLTLSYVTFLPDYADDIITDETKLVQILTNLIVNAIKFTKQGHVEFGYKIENEVITFFVKDTGIGIATDMYEEIFNRFRQVENASTRQFGGSGLGLSISKSYVELLGGKIWLESVLNKGTTFYFWLPYKAVITSSNLDHLEDKSILEKNQIKTILIVEDEDSNYLYLNELLSVFHYLIIRAVNGLEAVEICKSTTKIDLVLMDIKMPIMDGNEATKKIRSFLPNVPIIAQTAYFIKEDHEKAIASGCNDYITKPLDKKVLISKILELLK